jgi:hypothetical protein
VKLEYSIPVNKVNENILSRGRMRTFSLGTQSGIRNLLRVRPGHKDEIATMSLDSEGAEVGVGTLREKSLN